MNMFLAESSGLSNTSLDDFLDSLSTSSSITLTKQSFYYVNTNGLYGLRLGSQELAEDYFEFYLDQMDSLNTKFLLIMVFSLIVLGASELFLLPIVFSVQKTNAIVLSFFAIVPVIEIELFAEKCEKFLKVYIERKEMTDGSEYSKADSDPVEENPNQIEKNRTRQRSNTKSSAKKNAQSMIIQENNDNSNDKSRVNMEMSYLTNKNQRHPHRINDRDKSMITQLLQNKGDVSYLSNLNDSNMPSALPSSSKIHGGMNSIEPTMRQLQPPPTKDGLVKSMVQTRDRSKEEEEKQNENEDNQRHKILNAKDHKKKFVILQFSVLTCILMVYFILNFTVLEGAFQTNITNLLNHTKYTRTRNSLLKYYMTFLQEGLVDLSQLLEKSSQSTLISLYGTKIQENDNLITSSFKQSFPSSFTDYRNLFDQVNYASQCQYSGVTTSSEEGLQCSNLSALSSGLQRVVTQIGIDGNSIVASVSAYDGSSDKKVYAANLMKEDTAFKEIQDLMVFVAPSIELLNDSFIDAFKSYLSYKNTIDKLCFSLFVVFVCVTFVLLWMPFLAALIKRIWMTKGVLNMIPIEIILKHEKLREAFTAGDILSAVE